MHTDAFKRLIDIQKEDDESAAYDFIEGHLRALIGDLDEALQNQQDE